MVVSLLLVGHGDVLEDSSGGALGDGVDGTLIARGRTNPLAAVDRGARMCLRSNLS